ncbi:MAG: hypothetical protein GEV03_07020 [Streptosporangiales bacterium]|nr:hypothetical protein [Streptosporangiales bacterium]
MRRRPRCCLVVARRGVGGGRRRRRNRSPSKGYPVNRPNVSRAGRAFREDGYIVFRQVFSDRQIELFRELRDAAVRDWCFANGTTDRPLVVGDLLERYPRVMLGVVTHATLLDFAEAIMGPFVQLDSLVLFGAQPEPPDRRGRPVCWHRDRFGFFPPGTYTRPLTLICFAYLQPMTDEAGPLRVIPGSHRNRVGIADDDVEHPHPEEQLIRTHPGDVVAIHHNLLHSGTHNVSAAERQFLGISYTLTCLGTRDDTFDGPNCRALAETARRTHDRRLLRLLGHDDTISERQNTGFTAPDEIAWSAWRAEDDAHAKEASNERAAVDHARRMLK